MTTACFETTGVPAAHRPSARLNRYYAVLLGALTAALAGLCIEAARARTERASFAAFACMTAAALAGTLVCRRALGPLLKQREVWLQPGALRLVVEETALCFQAGATARRFIYRDIAAIDICDARRSNIASWYGEMISLPGPALRVTTTNAQGQCIFLLPLAMMAEPPELILAKARAGWQAGLATP
jgi:hypothetical protein